MLNISETVRYRPVIERDTWLVELCLVKMTLIDLQYHHNYFAMTHRPTHTHTHTPNKLPRRTAL